MSLIRIHDRAGRQPQFKSRLYHLLSALALVLAVPPVTLQAHPGHSLADAEFRHLITSPDHLAVLAACGLCVWFSARFVQRRLPRRVLQSLGLAALAIAGVLWGFGH